MMQVAIFASAGQQVSSMQPPHFSSTSPSFSTGTKNNADFKLKLLKEASMQIGVFINKSKIVLNRNCSTNPKYFSLDY